MKAYILSNMFNVGNEMRPLGVMNSSEVQPAP